MQTLKAQWAKLLSISFLAMLGVAVIIPAGTAEALSGSDFRAGRIIDDGQFFDGSAMTADQVQAFLNVKVPTCDTNGAMMRGSQTRAAYGASVGSPAPYTCLKDYHQDTPSKVPEAGLCGTYTAGNRSAAAIIYEVGRSCGVSQKVLLTLLQKEQALVTDDWPWPIEYRSATGFGCPDSAPCDADYYGFFNQVYNAARQFKRYGRDANLYNYRAGASSYVQYNPNASCGGGNVVMQNQATAGLYNYTPYQPNASALSNLYGTGDSCGAYGNRNFWRLYNDWFGTTTSDGYSRVIADDGNPTQYIMYGNIKQAIPTTEVLNAWGLQNIPLITFPASYLGSVTNGPPLDRVLRISGDDSHLYVVDGGRRYYISDTNMLNAWGLQGRVISSVPVSLGNLPIYSGSLTYLLKNSSNATTYTVDGLNNVGQPIIRPYANNNVMTAWEGNDAVTTIVSDDLFNAMDNAVGSTLTGTRISSGSGEYEVISGKKLPLYGPYAAMYPSTTQTVSPATIARLVPGDAIKHLVRSSSGTATFMIDNGKTDNIIGNGAVQSWTPDGSYVTIVNDAFINLIASGADITNYTASNAGQTYLINKTKTMIPTNIASAYGAGAAYAASNALLDLFPANNQTLTGYIKGSDSSLYVLDSSGVKHHIEWPTKAELMGVYSMGYTTLPDFIVNSYATGVSPQLFVSDGTTEYLLEGGKKHPVSSTVKVAWGLSGAQVYADGTLNRYPLGDPLDTKLQYQGAYFIIRDGVAYGTADSNIAGVWNVLNAPVMNDKLVSLIPLRMLARFVQSNVNGDNRLFIVDKGNWYHINDAQKANMGGTNAPISQLNPNNAPNTIIDWPTQVIKSANDQYFVIDYGTKRLINNPIIQNQWTANGTLGVTSVSDSFLNLLPTNGIIERTIRGTSPSAYFVENNTKRHILYPDTLRNYLPISYVNDSLLATLPDGPNI